LLSLFLHSQSLRLSVAAAAMNALRNVLLDNSTANEKLVQVGGLPLLLGTLRAVIAFYSSIHTADDDAAFRQEDSADEGDDDEDDDDYDGKMSNVFHDTLATLGMEEQPVQDPRHSKDGARKKNVPYEPSRDGTIAITTMEDLLAIILDIVTASNSVGVVSALVSSDLPDILVAVLRATPRYCAVQEHGCEIVWRLAAADANCARRLAASGAGDCAIEAVIRHSECGGGHGAYAGALYAACAVIAVVPRTSAVALQIVSHTAVLVLQALHRNVQNGSFVRRATAALVMLLRSDVPFASEHLCCGIFDTCITALHWHASNPALVACVCSAFNEMILSFPRTTDGEGHKSLVCLMPRLHMGYEFITTLVETLPFVPEVRRLLDCLVRECPSLQAPKQAPLPSTSFVPAAVAAAKTSMPQFNWNAASFKPRVPPSQLPKA